LAADVALRGILTTPTRIGLALCAVAVALLASSLAAAAAPAAVQAKRVDAPAIPPAQYWTKARMRAAEPADVALPGTADVDASVPNGTAAEPSYVPAAPAGSSAPVELLAGTSSSERSLFGSSREIPDPSAPGIRAHGKVFFTIPGEGDFVCSGTAVNSRNRSVVWTAGHCVFDAGPSDEGYTNRFSTNFIFVPAYRDGAAPFGRWTAKRLATTDPWRDRASLKYDLGAAVVRRHEGGRLQRVVGARGIGFNQPRDQVLQAIGYPQELPFNGQREFRCTGAPVGSDDPGGAGPRTTRIRCDMTGGSSGGGWIAGTTLLSVTSYGYGTDPGYLYGPYMAGTAKELYKSVRGKKRRRR